MAATELQLFIQRHGLTVEGLAVILGVSRQAVNFWVCGERKIAVTTAKLIRIFDKYPQLMTEFG